MGKEKADRCCKEQHERGIRAHERSDGGLFIRLSSPIFIRFTVTGTFAASADANRATAFLPFGGRPFDQFAA